MTDKHEVEHLHYLSTEEVAKVLKVTRRTVIKLIEQGELKGKRVLHQYRIERKDLEAYLEKE